MRTAHPFYQIAPRSQFSVENIFQFENRKSFEIWWMRQQHL